MPLTATIIIIGSLSGGVMAQTTFSAGGIDYETVQWAETSGFVFPGTTPYVGSLSTGTVTMTGFTAAQTSAGTVSTIGQSHLSSEYQVNGFSNLRSTGGQNGTAGTDLTQTFSLSNSTPVTEVLFYAGINSNGHKYTSWDWSSSDSGTVFTVVSSTNNAYEIVNDGTSALSWRSFERPGFSNSVGTNNTNAALVRITLHDKIFRLAI